MELVVKHFNELSRDELYEIYRLRVSVFIVEQNCPYRDIGEADRSAYHLWLEDEDGIVAYARVLPAGVLFDEPSVGRVISVKRRLGYGSIIVEEGKKVAMERFGASTIVVEAQVYARTLYEKAGFRQVSDMFLEDGIPHIMMRFEP